MIDDSFVWGLVTVWRCMTDAYLIQCTSLPEVESCL